MMLADFLLNGVFPFEGDPLTLALWKSEIRGFRGLKRHVLLWTMATGEARQRQGKQERNRKE